MARPYLPSFFGRGDDPFGSLFREVQKTFRSRRARSRRQGLAYRVALRLVTGNCFQLFDAGQ